MEHKITVIIPVYQTEKYLKQCVDSVLGQTHGNLEILLIDDGSTDQGAAMCDAYGRHLPNVRVVHQKNAGLSNVRNRGIREAAGEYLLFLDSDDYWDDPEFVRRLEDRLEESPCEVLNFRYRYYVEATGRYEKKMASCEEQQPSQEMDFLRWMLQKGLYIASACNKLVKKEFIQKKNLYFREGVRSEDVDWCARILLSCENMGYCNADAYVYRQREGSLSHTVQYETIRQMTENIRYCIQCGEKLRPGDSLYPLYYAFLAYQYGVFLNTNHVIRDVRVRTLRREMKSYRWLLNFRENPKVKLLYYANRYLGYEGMNLVMACYVKYKQVRFKYAIPGGGERWKRLLFLHPHIIGQIFCAGGMRH